MSEAFFGEIMMLPYTFSPVGWAYCNGQTMLISQNQALYAVIGNLYGGSPGQNTMAVPDLRGRSPISQGSAPGLTPRTLTQIGGLTEVTLTDSQMPSHTHQLRGKSSATVTSDPTGAVPSILRDGNGTSIDRYSTSIEPNYPMNGNVLGVAGGSVAHENRQPFLAINFFICIDGVFPSRN
ncbi:hypothetical protein BOO91_19485 [Vibrio navarrensis]|uniref:Phage tail protein n=1 Tax=Vibrio navarrensis TaxID=29495 RepID=A0AAJ4ICZ5_9VIBR|nr:MULTISPECIES: tail fiber protein [Vibrio]KJR12924.1 hypothetical protein UF06_23010 [Vibrio sp. S234-5]MBE3652706.1 hypothetical protein [Vibrio navarrensis]MBE3656863.1 hypothetical protein [Vibrio navarrensis]MBE3663109.1 hypothetical protein [Vibrio navarrensis]MBE4605732.1 hypothetical protein [Vibrio navarrensis]